MGSVAATWKDKYREPFDPVMPGVEFVRFDDVDDLKAKFSSEFCAILLEPIQGEGGIRPLSREFLHAARDHTRSTGALLIADEIQSGMAAPANSARTSTTASCPTSSPSPNPSPAAFPWARCSAPKTLPRPSTQACTEPPSEADL